MTDLERRLADLAGSLAVPTGDGLPAAVTARLAAPAERGPAGWRRWWRWLVGAVIVVTGVGVAPAVADWLGIGGVAVRQEPLPAGPTAPFEPGRAVDLDEVAALAGFEPLLPTALGEPDDVWVLEGEPAVLVWLRWDDGPLITQLAGPFDGGAVIQKFASGADVEEVRVSGRRALWVDGPHHLVLGDAEASLPIARREAAGTLLVEVGRITVRIETEAGRDAAIRVARSLPGT